jgi:nitrate reductase gamma subunit
MIFLLGAFCLGAGEAKASWFIDPREYHVSAHGQTSCQDCHGDVLDRKIHPDPSEVKKSRGDFFSPDTCIACHDEIQENLKAGKHGRKQIQDPRKYRNCIRCHKPHRQPRIGDNRTGTFQPGIPRKEQCGACHETRVELPPLAAEDESCMACHRKVDPQSDQGRKQIQALCFHCHATGDGAAKKATARILPLIDPAAYRNTVHAGQSCTACHPEGATFHHHEQAKGNCLRCHTRHDEKKTHDAHLEVTCEACHLEGVRPVRDSVSGKVLWNRLPAPGKLLQVHRMTLDRSGNRCRRCHTAGNRVGASALVLPAKSILCMGCHAATFSVGDTTTLIALFVFLVGLVMALSYWFSGSFHGKGDGLLERETHHGGYGKFSDFVRTFLLDVLFQRRLYRRSRGRWFIHALIFYPFLFRFIWGMTGLLGSLWRPESETVWVLLNKNHFLTAFVFDLSGLMLLLGIVIALARGTVKRFTMRAGLPKQDSLALGLIGGIVIVGFVLEGMRIAMTGVPGDAEYAFAGYWISTFFSDPSRLTLLYGYLWYGHAVLAAGFVAYLPFSRLFHIILAPVTLLMGGAEEHDHSGGKRAAGSAAGGETGNSGEKDG